MIKYCNLQKNAILSFFQEKKWHRSEKLDKNKCPFFCPGMENHFSKNVKFGFRA
jgi:hypothetical protein